MKINLKKIIKLEKISKKLVKLQKGSSEQPPGVDKKPLPQHKLKDFIILLEWNVLL